MVKFQDIEYIYFLVIIELNWKTQAVAEIGIPKTKNLPMTVSFNPNWWYFGLFPFTERSNGQIFLWDGADVGSILGENSGEKWEVWSLLCGK